MIKAIIFDMDGVISDTQHLHAAAESELLARCKIHISPEEITAIYAGTKTEDFFKYLLKKYNCSAKVKDLIHEKWESMSRLAEEKVDPIPGSIKLIKKLYKKGYMLAVTSSSPYPYVNIVLTKLKVKKYFSVIISGDMVENGKPAPDIFLFAAQKLNVRPNECIVIEDARSGMEGAIKAGMKCIGLVHNKKNRYPTQYIVTRLDQIGDQYLTNINK